MRFIKPLDEKLLHQIFEKHPTIIAIEDGVLKGGFGAAILEFASENNYTNKIKILGIPDEFIAHGNVHKLQEEIGLDPKSLNTFFEHIS
jgi:1-deoxy-D-xylulose-5-phosphate synthase